MIYSSPSEFRLGGRRYLKTVPATLKFWGLSMAELPLKKKCPDSSASASKRERKGTNVILCAERKGCTGTEESKQLTTEKSPTEKELQALQCSSSPSGQIRGIQCLLLSLSSPTKAQMSSQQGLPVVSLVSKCPSCCW